MDIESAGGTNLINGVSTATSYTQTLNEVDSSREDRRYNSLDTRIRYASRFYNEANFEMPLHLQEILDNPDVTQQDRRDVRIVMRGIMQNP